eukprot:COSAG01_NODE_43939_length_424_cov_1.400000_2_plen_33_part_01
MTPVVTGVTARPMTISVSGTPSSATMHTVTAII